MQNTPDINPSLSRNIEEYRGRKDPAAMKAMAKEMEAMFAYEMIKVMRETSDMSAKGSLGKDTYMSLFDQEISRILAERGLGLRDMLEKGLQHMANKAGNVPTALDKQNIKTEGKQPVTDEIKALLPAIGLNKEKQALIDEVKTLLPDIDRARISSGYGRRQDPYTGEQKNHFGLDIAAPEGTEVHSVRNGTVLFSGEQKGYGNVVVIDHGDGFLAKYAHNQINLVQQGQEVEAGSVIAQVGSTGRSTGPHVHFEVLYQGEHVHPDTLLALRQD